MSQISYPASADPKAIITVPGRTPRSAAETPQEINGVKVIDFEMPEPVIRRFYRSQLARMTPEQFAENQADIDLAQQHNLIIDDLTNPATLEAMDRTAAESGQRILTVIKARDSKLASDAAYRELSAARTELETAKQNNDAYQVAVLSQKVADLATAAEASSATAREAAAAAQEAKNNH